MANEQSSLGVAVLTLTTDSKQLDAGLNQVVQKAQAAAKASADAFKNAFAAPQAQTSESFRRLYTDLDTTGNASNAAADKFRGMFSTVKQGSDVSVPAVAKFGGAMQGALSTVELFTGTLTAAAAIKFADSLISDASHLKNLSAATGVTTDDLQRLTYVGAEFGLGVDEWSHGVEQLSARLAGGDKSASRAVSDLGLNIDKLIQAGPKEAFLQVAEAAGRVEDPMLKGSYALDLFGGKLAKVLLPALGELRTKLDAVPKESIVDQKTIDKADEFDNKVHHLIQTLKAYADLALFGPNPPTAGGRAFMLTGQKPGGGDWESSAGLISKDAPKNNQELITNKQILDNWIKGIRDGKAAVDELTASQRSMITEADKAGRSETEIAQHLKISEDAVHRYVAEVRLQEEAHKKAEEQIKKVLDAQQKLWGSTVQLSAGDTKLVQTLLDEGNSAETIATALGLNAVAVQQVATERERLIKIANFENKENLENIKTWKELQIAYLDAANTINTKLVVAYGEFTKKRGLMGLSAHDAEMKRITDEQDLWLNNLPARTEQNRVFYDLNLRAGTEYYQHLKDLANHTQDTIVERMRNAGVLTRAELKTTADFAKLDFDQMRASGLYTIDALRAAWEKWFKIAHPDLVRFHEELNTWGNDLSNLAAAFDGKLGRVVTAIAQVVTAWNAAAKAADSYRAASMKTGSSGSGAGQAGAEVAGVEGAIFSGKDYATAKKQVDRMGQALAIAQGITAIAQATKGGGIQGILGGALSAAEMGNAIAGPWGAAVGAGVGAIIGALRTDHTLGDLKRTGKAWGVSLSDGLLKQLADDSKTYGGEVQAMAMNLDKVIAEAGGVAAFGVDKAMSKLHDVFSLIQNHQLTVAQGTKVLDANFAEIAAAGTDSYGRIGSKLKELIALDDQFKTHSKAVGEFLKTQGSNALSGFAAVANAVTKPILDAQQAANDADTALEGGIVGMTDGMQKAGAYTTGLVKDILDLQAKIGDLNKKDTLTDAQKRQLDAYKDKLGTLQYEYGKLSDTQKAAGDALEAFAKDGKQNLDDLGIQAVASFEAATAAGVPWNEALAQAAPQLQNLKKAYEALGIPIEDVALKALLVQSTMATAAPDLMAGVAGLSQEFVALDNLSAVTPENFAAMERTGARMYERLQTEAQKAGGESVDALLPMQGFLHQAEDAAKKYGLALDEGTQKMIDLSKEDGIWHDESETANDIMIEGFSAIILAVGGEIPKAWQHMADEAKRAADKAAQAAEDEAARAQAAFDSVTPPDLSGSYDFGGQTTTPPVEGSARGSLVRGWGLEYLKTGGIAAALIASLFVPRGTDTVPAMLTPGEGVVNTLGMSNLGVDGLRAYNRGQVPARGGGDTSRMEAQLTQLNQTSRESVDRLDAIEQAVMANRVTSVQANGRELLQVNIETLENGGAPLTRARQALGVR